MDPLEYPNQNDNSNKLEYHNWYKMALTPHLLCKQHHIINIHKVSLSSNSNEWLYSDRYTLELVAVKESNNNSTVIRLDIDSSIKFTSEHQSV